MRRSSLIATLLTALFLVSGSREARAGEDGKAVAMLIMLGAFDLVSLPADMYMGIRGEKVPEGYAMAEAILGGAQVAAGGIGTIVCATDSKCKGEAWMPLLIGYTVWTSIMTIHGAWELGTAKTSTTRSTDKPSSAAPAGTSGGLVRATPLGPVATMPVGSTGTLPFGGGALKWAVAPMIGDGRTTPLGLGLVGSF